MSSTKKKVILAFTSLALVIVVALVAVIAVFAARNVTVNSGFTITYTAYHVKADITGTYKVNTDATATDLTTSSGSSTTISFTGSEATDGTANVKSFDSVTISLTAAANESTKYVDFVYSITNNDTTNSINIALNSDPNTNDDNLDYTYSVSLVSNSDATSTGTTYDNLVVGLVHGKTATITIRVTVSNLDNNVSKTANFAFVLTATSAS